MCLGFIWGYFLHGVWHEIGIQLPSLPHGCHFVPKLSVEKATSSLLSCLICQKTNNYKCKSLFLDSQLCHADLNVYPFVITALLGLLIGLLDLCSKL